MGTVGSFHASTVSGPVGGGGRGSFHSSAGGGGGGHGSLHPGGIRTETYEEGNNSITLMFLVLHCPVPCCHSNPLTVCFLNRWNLQ